MSKSNEFWRHGTDGPEASKPNTWWRGISNSRNDDVVKKPLPDQNDATVLLHKHGSYPRG